MRHSLQSTDYRVGHDGGRQVLTEPVRCKAQAQGAYQRRSPSANARDASLQHDEIPIERYKLPNIAASLSPRAAKCQ